MTRGRPPQSEPLWGDSLPEEPADRKPAAHEPPDWALPAWDTVPAEPDDIGPRPKPTAGAPAAPPPAAPTTTPPMGPVAQPPAVVPPVGRALAAESTLRILGVSEVTRAIRDAVRAEPTLREVWV